MRQLVLATVLAFGMAAGSGGQRLSADDFVVPGAAGHYASDQLPQFGNTVSRNCSCGHCSGCQSSRFFAAQEYLLIRTHFSEALAFARVRDAVVGGLPNRTVRSEELDFDYDSSFRSVIGVHLNDSADLRFRYWHLDVDTLVTGTAAAGENIVDPYGGIAAAGMTIDAMAAVRMNIYDLEYVRRLRFTRQNLGFEYSAGLRFADVEQFSTSTIRNGGALASQGVFSTDFFGVGPYLTMTGKANVPCRERISLLAKMGTALLVGHYEVGSDFTAPGAFSGGQDAERTRIVPVLEAELGSEWQPSERLTITAGWLFQAWFNLGASGGTFDPNIPAAIDPTLQFNESAFVGTDDADVQSFDGLFVRGELSF